MVRFVQDDPLIRRQHALRCAIRRRIVPGSAILGIRLEREIREDEVVVRDTGSAPAPPRDAPGRRSSCW